MHADELKRLATEAEGAEASGDLATAASRWQDALALLPEDTRQREVIGKRIESLGARMIATDAPKPKEKRPGWTRQGGAIGVAALLLWKFKFVLVFLLTKAKLLLLGLTKLSTLGSMLLAFGVYWTAWGWPFAAGLVVSIYIHEMGHVAWLARYGIKASAPMFIPGFGALVRLKQYPPTPGLDARVGLAGPLYGLGAAALAWVVFQLTGAPIWGAIARVGAWLNLFNLMPVWSLDGGRGFRALTRKERFIAAAVLGATWYVSSEPLVFLLLVLAVVRAFGEAPEESDQTVLLWYTGLVIALAMLTRIAVEPGVVVR